MVDEWMKNPWIGIPVIIFGLLWIAAAFREVCWRPPPDPEKNVVK